MIILLNFIIDYLLLFTVKKILKINVKNKRLLLSSLFGEISILYFFIDINNFGLIIFKIVICIFMILIAFGYNDIKSFIQNIIYFLIVLYFLGGVLYYFQTCGLIKYSYYLLMIPIILNIYEYFAYNLKNILNTKYKVNIYLNNGKILFLNGYMDTGNLLLDPYSNKKVIIINKEVYENYFYIPYETIDNRDILKCFIPKRVYIDGIGERKDIVVGIVNRKFNGYNCLLNYKLMEDI